MIEQIVYDHLKDCLSAHVALEEHGTALPMVLLKKTDSKVEDFINTSTIVCLSYGKTLLEAAELNQEVKIAMLALSAHEQIASCKVVTDFNNTDTASKRYRYQAVFYVTHY